MSDVYFMRMGAFVKIGISCNPAQRAKTLLGGNKLILPDGLDASAPVEILRLIHGCRRRDERNMQLLFGAYWVEGEWFRWSPAFRFQMETVQFVTHAERLIALRRARAAMGITSTPVKEENWGMNVTETQAYCRALREASLTAEQVAA